MVAGQTIAQRVAAGHTLFPLHDGRYVWSRLSDGKEFVGTFDQLRQLIDALFQASPAATLPVGATDNIYVIQAGVMRQANVQDVVAVVPTLPQVTSLALTDDLYVIQGGALKRCDVQDILNINLTTTSVGGQNFNVTLAHTKGVILEATNNAFPQSFILPEDTGNPAVDIPINGTVEVVQVGSQQSQFTLGNPGTMSFLAAAGTKARAQGSSIYARRRAANTWHVTGDTTP